MPLERLDQLHRVLARREAGLLDAELEEASSPRSWDPARPSVIGTRRVHLLQQHLGFLEELLWAGVSSGFVSTGT